MAAGADPNAENCDVMSDDVEGDGRDDVDGDGEDEDRLNEGHTAFDLSVGNNKVRTILTSLLILF